MAMRSFDDLSRFEQLVATYYPASMPNVYKPALTRRELHVATLDHIARSKSDIDNSLEVGLVRASDIAFPAGDNVYDHSPSAPFTLDQRLLNTAKTDLSKNMNVVEFPDKNNSSRPFGMRTVAAGPSDPNHICIFSFGSEKSTCWSCVFCDLDTYSYLQAHPLYNKPLYAEPHVSRMPVYVADTPDGRGKGLYAARAFREGDVLLREPPLLVMRQGMPSNVASSMNASLEKWMPRRALKAFDALDNCWPSDEASRRINIARTNMVGIELLPSKDMFGGAFELLSRVNHSCDPNVMFDWNYETFQCAMVARADIDAGQELTLGYTDIDASKAERQAELQRMFRFTCKCPICGPE